MGTAERFPLELGTGDQESTVMVLPCREGSVTISLAVWIQYMNVTDRQTDRRTDAGTKKTALTYSVARYKWSDSM